MLTGEFAESFKETVTLRDDNPNSLKMAFDIIYGQVTGAINPSSFLLTDLVQLNIVIDKYELNGVASFVSSVGKCAALEKQIRRLQQEAVTSSQTHEYQVRDLKSSHEGYLKYRLMGRGMLVDYQDRPEVGTRVQENEDCRGIPRNGKIISNSEDGGTEIGVRWDDGTESHHLWCGKKGGHALKYL